METMINNISFFLLIIAAISLVIAIIQQKMQLKRKAVEDKIVQEAYPHLSTLDRQYRQGAQSVYQKFYFGKKITKLKLKLLLIVIMLFVLGIFIGCILSDNWFSSYLYLAILLFLSLLLALVSYTEPNAQEEYTFWEQYLEQHPDNPLMAVLIPLEETAHLDKKIKQIAILQLILRILFLSMLGLFIYFIVIY